MTFCMCVCGVCVGSTGNTPDAVKVFPNLGASATYSCPGGLCVPTPTPDDAYGCSNNGQNASAALPAVVCTECEAGKYHEATSSGGSCKNCPAGTFKSTSGVDSCSYCGSFGGPATKWLGTGITDAGHTDCSARPRTATGLAVGVFALVFLAVVLFKCWSDAQSHVCQ